MQNNGKSGKGFWCGVCGYGSASTRIFTRCPQCGKRGTGVTKAPYPPQGTKNKNKGQNTKAPGTQPPVEAAKALEPSAV